MINNNLYIKLKENLDKNDCVDINNLKNICIDYDKTFLKLETDYKYNNPNRNSDNLNHINEFMFYEGNKLIGYAGICDFGGEALEVNGMVHPDYRRKGIFTRLFILIKDEFNKRKTNNMLLLSDNKSFTGIEFIKNVGGDYEHSEYDMNLDMDVTHELNTNLVFRKLINEDLNNISKENFEFFDNSSYDTYVIEKNGVIIGKSRLEINDNIGGIYGLEVIPEYRGKGYGRELLLLSIKKLKENNVNSITLQVETNNKNALNLYKSCGFKENYTMDYYIIKKSVTKVLCHDLETPQLILRKLSLDDVDDLFQVFSDEETTNYVPRIKHINKLETINYLESLITKINEGKSIVWSVLDKTDKQVIGTVSLYFKEDKAASIGAVIKSDRWGKGIATEALKQVIHFGFEKMKLVRIEGKCETRNISSEKMLKKLGMTYEGTLRKEVMIKGIQRDAKVFSLLIEEYINNL